MTDFRISNLTDTTHNSGDTSQNAIVASKLLDSSNQPFPITRVADTSPLAGLKLESLDTPSDQNSTSVTFGSPFKPTNDTQTIAQPAATTAPSQDDGLFRSNGYTGPDIRGQKPKELHVGLGAELSLVAAIGFLAMRPTQSGRVLKTLIMDGARLGGRAAMHNPKTALAIAGGLFIEHELGLDKLF